MATELVENMEGLQMINEEPKTQPISLLWMPEEKRVLELYDRLEELQLEISLLKAQGVLSSEDEPEEVTEEDLATAQQELLNAKAAYTVRSRVVEGVLIADPVIKAIHSGKVNVVERDLLPHIKHRDDLSISLNGLFTKVLSARNELKQVQTQHIVTARKNAELAETMLGLAEEANTQRKEDINDPKARERLDQLEAERKESQQRWRIIKETVSATIAGSGVDWTRDMKLLEIVIDKDG